MSKYILTILLGFFLNYSYATDAIENPKNINLEFKNTLDTRKIIARENDNGLYYSSSEKKDYANLVNVRFELKSGNNELFLQKDILIDVSEQNAQVIFEDFLSKEINDNINLKNCAKKINDFSEKFNHVKTGVRAIINREKNGNIALRGILTYHNFKDEPMNCDYLFTEQYKFSTVFHMDNLQVMEWSRFVDSRQSFIATSFDIDQKGVLENYQLKNVILRIVQ